MIKKLLSLLGIRPEEWPRVRWMVLHSVALRRRSADVRKQGSA